MKNIVDQLNEKIIELQSPISIGIDPVLEKIPNCYKEPYAKELDPFQAAASAILDFSKDIIDVTKDKVVCVKPQIAFYEMYGPHGLIAFRETVRYAKSKGLIVITDGKRNDIGNTARAYAKSHLGKVNLGNGKEAPCFDADFLTVSPYLGKDSLLPFVDECIKSNKGIFVLVKTSNPSSSDIQDIVDENGSKIYTYIANFVNEQANRFVGKSGYSSIGAVVGATYPEVAKELRKTMSKSIFLVPGYGAQGATIKDITNCFNEDGLGAIINAARSIIYAYQKDFDPKTISKEEFQQSVADATDEMRSAIIESLANVNKLPKFSK